jgi:CDP-glucose 4,6-dehydratase
LLMVDSTRARTLLGWQPRYSLDRAIKSTAIWYRTFYDTGHIITDEQIAHYQAALESGEDA